MRTYTLQFHDTTNTVTVHHRTFEAAAVTAIQIEASNPDWGRVAAIIEN
jgi:hypothetical protein